MQKNIFTFLSSALMIFSVSSYSQNVEEITIDPSRTYQTIESFGASDCWTAKDVGAHWKNDVKEEIAKQLFSSELKRDGSPEGIALSAWRFNLGAGSTVNEELHPTRQTESFLNETNDGYDWMKQAGQQWFMEQARMYGCNDFVAFANSPLVKYTKKGKAYAGQGESGANLQDDKYDDYAEYVADVMLHFENEGKAFKYFSPVNEPQYGWDNSDQEGSPWQNHNIKKIAEKLDKSFQKRNLSTKILISEAGDWTYLYKTDPNKYGGRASNQIYEFFDRRADYYIGNLPSLAPIIGAHSYWTTGTNTQLKDVRTEVNTLAKKYDLSVFQTEWSMLSGGQGIPGDLGESSYMDNALFLAKVIYSDLEYANVTSWSYWTALGIEQWNHKNRFLLISLVPQGGVYGDITKSGTASATKNLWVLGNYSYFIRPGYKRLKMKGADDLAGLMGTAYLAPDSSRIVAVYVNMAAEDKKIKTQFENLTLTPVSNKRYLTNSLYDLKKYGSSASDKYTEGTEFVIPARSVMTFVYDLEKETSKLKNIGDASLSLFPNPAKKGDIIKIDFPNKAGNSYEYALCALNGDVIFKSARKNGLSPVYINLPLDIQSGIYLLHIKGKNNNYINKVIVE